MNKKYTKIGAIIGMGVGSIIGLVVSQSVFLFFASSQVFAIGMLLVFSLALAAIGSFMGALFDIDARERGVSHALHAKRRRIKTKTQPFPTLR